MYSVCNYMSVHVTSCIQVLPSALMSTDKYECSNEVLGSGAFAVVKTCYSKKDHLQLAVKVCLGEGWEGVAGGGGGMGGSDQGKEMQVRCRNSQPVCLVVLACTTLLSASRET